MFSEATQHTLYGLSKHCNGIIWPLRKGQFTSFCFFSFSTCSASISALRWSASALSFSIARASIANVCRKFLQTRSLSWPPTTSSRKKCNRRCASATDNDRNTRPEAVRRTFRLPPSSLFPSGGAASPSRGLAASSSMLQVTPSPWPACPAAQLVPSQDVLLLHASARSLLVHPLDRPYAAMEITARDQHDRGFGTNVHA